MKTDGGPAFPQHGWTSSPDVLARMADQGGMSLRDWFAGMAMSGVDITRMSREEIASAVDRAIFAGDAFIAILAKQGQPESAPAPTASAEPVEDVHDCE